MINHFKALLPVCFCCFGLLNSPTIGWWGCWKISDDEMRWSCRDPIGISHIATTLYVADWGKLCWLTYMWDLNFFYTFFSFTFDSFSVSLPSPPMPKHYRALSSLFCSLLEQFSPSSSAQHNAEEESFPTVDGVWFDDDGLGKACFSSKLNETLREQAGEPPSVKEMEKKKKESYQFNKTMIFHRGSS